MADEEQTKGGLTKEERRAKRAEREAKLAALPPEQRAKREAKRAERKAARQGADH